jgi:hypothetical protein
MSRPFILNGKDAAILPGTRYIITEKMLCEAANGCQATVPSSCGVAALRFDVM